MFLYVTVGRGDVVHVHHLVYGIVILSIIGFISTVFPQLIQRKPHLAAILYGISLGLIFDEAALWLRLEDDYDHRLSYDAIIMVGSLLGLAAYFAPFWRWYLRMQQKLRLKQLVMKLPLIRKKGNEPQK